MKTTIRTATTFRIVERLSRFEVRAGLTNDLSPQAVARARKRRAFCGRVQRPETKLMSEKRARPGPLFSNKSSPINLVEGDFEDLHRVGAALDARELTLGQDHE